MQNKTLTGFRLSPQQKRLWISQQDSLAYLAQCALLLEGKLDAPALQDALRKVMDRHEILRTTFHRRSGMKIPLQAIADRTLPEWRTVDRCACQAAEQDARIAQLLREEAGRPFDYQHGPLVRACLLALSADKHVLVLSLPALCADTQTLKSLVQEICLFYSGGSPGEQVPEQPLQYADFSEWQNQLLETNDGESQSGKAFWSELILDSLPPQIVPFQEKPAPEAKFIPDSVMLKIDHEIFRTVEELARLYKSSPGTFLLTCWYALLGRLSGLPDIVVGTVLDGRKQEELQGALGLYAQVLPVRAHLENSPFVDLLRQVQESVGNVRQWQEYFDYEETAESVGKGRRTTADFEFEVVPSRRSAGNISFLVYRQCCHLNPFSLKLSCTKVDGSCCAAFYFDPQLVRREEVQRIAGYFERLLASVIVDPKAPIDSLEILSPAEQQQLLVTFNQTQASYPFDKCIHQLFEEQVERTPNRPALVFEGRQFTYAELNVRANQVAHFLRRRGVGPNVAVGLCVERSAEMVIGVLGILKAGGAYVPIHSELPKARLAYQIAETKAPLVVTQEKLLELLAEIPGEPLCLDRDLAVLANEPRTNPPAITTAEDLVYVIYTSGSTGVPKGVAVRHRNLVNYSHFIERKLGLEEESDREQHFATVSTLSADLGNTCIFSSLISGGCLHVISYETSMDGNSFARYVSKHPIDVLKITPSHLSALLATQEGGAILPRKYLILGGETCSWELIQRVTKVAQCAVINHYGPTETTVGSLTFSLREKALTSETAATVPIGRPIANTEVYILNPYGKPVPVGAPGELCIGGAGVARGYLNQPEQTADRFIHHPFSTDPDARLYKTGDRARFLPDGNVEFLGRLDQQVKIRGFRVEPAEIEAVLRRLATVQQAVVVAQDDKSGEKGLVAYFVKVPGRGAKVDELRSFLLEQLPDYMVPSVYVALESLPLTPNGKVDYRALPAPDQVRPQAEKIFVAPRNEVEEVLAAIWVEVLKLDQVGIHDNFFELGGHSLLATQIISRIRTAFQVQLPLRSIFETPTVADLAQAIVQIQSETPQAEEIDRLLGELEGLSEEEVQRLLAIEMQAGEN
jgi:amino acid adenylation domain-containing protein